MNIEFEFGSGLMIFDRVMPLELRKNGKFYFSIIISTTFVHIQLKFDIWMCYKNIQGEFEFGFGPIIFDRVVPLEL